MMHCRVAVMAVEYASPAIPKGQIIVRLRIRLRSSIASERRIGVIGLW